MNIFISFCILYFLNLVLDFPLQSFLKDWKVDNTKFGNYSLFVHCAIWSLGIFIGVWFLGLYAWWKLPMLFIGHWAMDYWKCRGLYKTNLLLNKFNKKIPLISDWKALMIDQSFHTIQVILCLL